MENRKYIYLTGRVHPGETNSSYVLHGLIQFLLSDEEEAKALLDQCIFKIVPMINPDGVINGSHRCSLAGLDLNRQWVSPSRILTPTLFWTKLMYRLIKGCGHTPLLACDFHGHSRKKNIFLYGCETDDAQEKVFPSLLSATPIFDLSACKYAIEKSKEATARVVLRNEFGILNSFTMESTYCGFDMGDRKGYQVQVADLESMGVAFCKTLLQYLQGTSAKPSPLPKRKKTAKKPKKKKVIESESESDDDG
jgi:predicted deacylase